jgi:N-acetylglucosamine-6-phosphate deacetylase
MKKTSVRIINGKLVTPHQILEHKTLWIEEGKIARITETVSDA